MKIINNLKESINNFKEKVSNPKTKLVIYAAFIFIVVLLVRIGNTNEVSKVVNNTSSLSQTNYQFEYYINYQDNYYNITGTRYNNIQLLEYNEQKYYLKDNTLYEIIDNTITKSELDSSILIELLSENIYNNTINSEKISEINIDDVITRTYNIKYKGYLYEVITHDSGSDISAIEINQNDLNLHITINYSNIGKVNKIEVNYEEV